MVKGFNTGGLAPVTSSSFHMQEKTSDYGHSSVRDASLPCFSFPVPQSNAFLLLTDPISCILSQGNPES